MRGQRNKELGARIKKIRVVDLELRQKEFAQSLGISQGMLSRYEKGTVPPVKILLKVARMANITIDSLLTSMANSQ